MEHNTGEIKPKRLGLSVRRAAAAALVLGIALALTACGGGNSGGTADSPAEYHGLVLVDPLAKPDFTLEDTSGAPFDFLKETGGYVTLLYFGYTNCPDICPSQMAGVAAALADVPHDVSEKVKVVFVSVDPDRDTPDRLTLWLGLFNDSFIGLRGDINEIDSIQQQALGPLAFSILRHDLGEGNYTVSHSALIIVYTTDNLAHIAYPEGVYKRDWANDLTNLVKKGWEES